ncbi:von Willebrand factor type A domain-containing protein, partial [Stachybotrys elegans]
MAQTRRWPFCGCLIPKENLYLPLLKPEAYTNIFTTSSRTVLKQTFINPQDRPLNEVRYFFPIYDGVSVVSFKCVIGARVIQGVVKEREEARSEYKAAIDSGSTAALLEMSPDASDVFTTSLGNVPANETIEVEITYLAELKHDAETDGIRLTIPTSIAPRYGHASHESWPRLLPDSKGKYYTPTTEEGITFTVDIQMFKDSVIRSVQSPSHPISVSIGTTSTDPSAEPCMQKASASLSLGSTALDKDFVVQITATNLGNPWALLETHPTLPNQRALTATLVPKFALPAETPEVVFICDRSGSMGVGNNIPNLISALQIFLRSLPIGAKFNICSFGSRHEFLWSKSKSYTQESLQEATKYVAKVQADFGGTEMYEPLRETFSRRYKDINLEVFLLTDGEVWQQDRLFELINNEVAVSKGAIRVFTLGVGNGVSHALIEGAARAGNGFSQTVGENEKMTSKVVRMLKAALSPHITDYTLEIKYDTNSDSDDEFMLVEKINDSLNITVTEIPESPQSDSPPKSKLRKLATKPLSLFNPDLKEEPIEVPKEFPAHSSSKRFSRLPHVETPRYIQAPHEIPPMFPFSRSTVYVLLSDSAPDRQPTSVVLRATSAHGPLELEVPVTTLPEKGLTIHQLAARKTIHELEGRRGWIFHAKDKKGRLLKEAHESCFSDMVEREAVRLGVKYQTAGKWCSFVAVDSSKTESDAKKS